jgi:hypothetical protein
LPFLLQTAITKSGPCAADAKAGFRLDQDAKISPHLLQHLFGHGSE